MCSVRLFSRKLNDERTNYGNFDQKRCLKNPRKDENTKFPKPQLPRTFCEVFGKFS